MARKVHKYESENLIVEYDGKRCIHAGECARGLPAVFDTGRRPWIDPSGASAEEIERVIERCPTGALHYRRKEGGGAEATASANTVNVAADGPLYLRGRLRIGLPEGETLQETRAALCRCGHSKDKPFCDNSHGEAGFCDDGEIAGGRVRPGDGNEERTLEIIPAKNGPLVLKGFVTIRTPKGATAEGVSCALCRCGRSATKPFCDGTHKQIGFEAD